MNISGTTTLTADRATVWRALNDPSVLVASIPGCQRLEALGQDAYKMTVSAGVGSIKGVYDGEVRLSDHEEPAAFRMRADGAGAPGTIGADVQVRLDDHPEGGTVLSYDAEATVGGMIGGVGQRMLTGVSRKMAEEFFRNVDAMLLAQAGVVPEAAGEGVTAPGAPGAGETPTAAAGTVFTSPRAAGAAAGSPVGGFALGVLTGVAAALAGAVVGAWIAGRRRR